MPHKITLIASAVCLAFIGAWYLDFIPESWVPLMFFIIIVIGLHIVIDLLMTTWETVYKFIRRK
ncbi:MAG: hypothetical protein L3J61_01365 [Ghiorsea sp.]|nr:hypothetical protein [Ghiorsea sp.]